MTDQQKDQFLTVIVQSVNDKAMDAFGWVLIDFVLDTVVSKYPEIWSSSFELPTLIRELVSSGMLQQQEMRQQCIRITLQGYEMLRLGGFGAYFKNKKEKRKLEIDQIKSSITTNILTWINVGITILLTSVIVWLQFKTNAREELREIRETRKELKDSLQQLQQSRRDSIYENYLLRKAKEDAIFLKGDTTHK